MLPTRKLPPCPRPLMLPPPDIEQMSPLEISTSLASNVHPTPKHIRCLRRWFQQVLQPDFQRFQAPVSPAPSATARSGVFIAHLRWPSAHTLPTSASPPPAPRTKTRLESISLYSHQRVSRHVANR